MAKLLGVLLVTFLLSSVARADNRYWIGSSANSFSDNTKWSTTEGGANDTTAPGVGSVAYFTTGTGATIATAVSVDGIQLASGFTGTVTASASLEVGSSGFTIAGGTFTASAAAFSTPSVTMTGGTFNLAAQTSTRVSGNITQSGGTFTPPSTSMTVAGNVSVSAGTFTAPPTLAVTGAFSHTGGTYTHGSGTVRLQANSPQNLAATGPLYNMEVGTAAVTGTNTGLVLHWKLDETTGTTVTDASGSGHHGTRIGSSGVPSYSTDIPTQIDFSNTRSGGFTMASSHAIEIATMPSTLQPAVLTMSAWYKATAVDTSGSDIISFGDNHTIRLTTTTIDVCKRLASSHVCMNASVSGHLDGNWHHVAATMGATGMKFYLDGVEKGTNGDAQTAQYNLGTGFYVGREGNGSTSFDFGGNIDDVRIYDTDLGATQIKNLYLGSAYSDHGNGSDSGLVAYWKLNETTATDDVSYAQDSSGNGHHATYVSSSGNPTPSTDVAAGFGFPNGRSMDLNDTNNQGAQITSLPAALKPTTVSISAWIKGAAADLDTKGAEIVDVGTGYDLGFLQTGIPRIKKYTAAGTSVNCSGTSAVTDNAWHHIVGILESTGARLYVDGVLRSSNCTNTSSIYYSTTTLEIGRQPGSTEDEWGGYIDEVRIYDRALTGAEVASLYAGSEFTDGTNSTEGGTAATGATHTLVGNLTVDNNLTINAAATLNGGAGSYTTAVTGAWSSPGTFTGGNGTVELKNTTGGTLPSETWHSLNINGLGATWTLPGALTVPGDLTITAGTLDVGSGLNYDVTVGGSFVNTGSFTAQSGTVTLNGTAAGKTMSDGSTTLYNLTVNGSGGVWTLSSDMTVTNDLTLTAGTLAGSSRVIYLRGNWTNDGGTFTPGTSTLHFIGTNPSKTITTRSGQSFHHFRIAAGGSWTMQDAIDINGDYTQSNGTLTTGSFPMTIGGGFNKSGGTLNEGTSTITFDGATNEIIRSSGTNLYNVVISGAGTWTLNTISLQLDGTLTVSNGTLATSSLGLTTVGTATINGGRLNIGTGSATMQNGLTVSSGTLELSNTGTLNITNGKTLSVTGTLKDTSAGNVSTIKATGGGTNTFAFTVNSGATIDLEGMNIQNTDASGMQFPAAAGVTFTNFKNVAFTGGSTTAGAKYLNLTATALDLLLLGFSFDDPGAGTYNVALAGDGTANQTQLVLECNTATGTGGAGCGDARDADDDANDDGIADNPGSNGSIVHWLRNIKADLTGTLVGMPVRAINWNNFTYYATYAGYNNASATQARVTVRDADGTSAYYYDFTAGETMVGAPRPYHDNTNKYVFVGMTNGKLYKLVDDGSSLAVATNWPTTYAVGSTISTPLSVDGGYVYFAGLSGDAEGVGTYRAVFRVTHTGASPVWGSIFGTGTSAAAALTAAPSLAQISATDYLFFGANDHFFRVQASNMTGNDNSVASAHVNSRITIVNERFFAADDDGKLWVRNATEATLGQLWSYQDTASHGGSCSSATCKIENFYVDLPPDSAERVYWGDADGHVYGVKQNGTGGSALTGYPFRPDSATYAYDAAPLFDNGTLVVGNTAGSVFVINASTTAEGNPSVVRVYRFGTGSSVASINMDRSTYGGAGGYLVATTNGRWFYLPRYTDPDGHQ